jgi:hypothetical protein
MNLTIYIDNLRQHLAVAAEAGGEESRALAERLTAPLESAVRLVLLEALSAAADEITRELAPGAVEVRLRGGDPAFVVTPSPDEATFEDIAPAPESGDVAAIGAEDGDTGSTARLNLRLPETLKERIENAASTEGLSLNAWLLRAAAAALSSEGRPRKRTPSGGDRYTGWVR